MSGQFTESCRTLEKANRYQMSGQFIESCRTLVKVAPSKGVPNFVKRRAIKRRAQFIKRRAIKRRAIKRRVHFVKRCAMKRRASLSGGKRRAIRVAASAIYPRRRLRLRHTILKPLKPTLR
ncbi:unnamed protein product [Camellia sinensis]